MVIGLPKKRKTVSTRPTAFILKSEWEKTRGKVMITPCFDHLYFSLYIIYIVMLNWFVDQKVSECKCSHWNADLCDTQTKSNYLEYAWYPL